MKINLRKEKFEAIESCFSDIKKDRNKIPEATKRIEKHLEDVFHKNMTVIIIDPEDKNGQFFVMSIFPDTSTLEALVVGILNQSPDEPLKKIWDETNDWNIEIDRRIFNDDYISITPKEMTALLLHEIGHIVYSNSIPQRVSRIMKFEVAKANIETKAVLRNTVFRGILELPILNACCYDQYKTNAGIKKELKSDVFVIKMGYGKELESVLDKFISTDKSKVKIHPHINQSDSGADKNMKDTIHFSISVVEDFKKRKTNVAHHNLVSLIKNMPSDFIRCRIMDIMNKLTKSTSEYESDVAKMERVCDIAQHEVEEMYTREFFEFRSKRFKRIDPRVIDYIEVNSQTIKNNDDKMILINYIYTNLDQIDYRISVLKNPRYAARYEVPDSLDLLLRYKERLERARDYVVNYKIPEKHYGLTIQYPEGYEG